jgi:hypothetical protein
MGDKVVKLVSSSPRYATEARDEAPPKTEVFRSAFENGKET